MCVFGVKSQSRLSSWPLLVQGSLIQIGSQEALYHTAPPLVDKSANYDWRKLVVTNIWHSDFKSFFFLPLLRLLSGTCWLDADHRIKVTVFLYPVNLSAALVRRKKNSYTCLVLSGVFLKTSGFHISGERFLQMWCRITILSTILWSHPEKNQTGGFVENWFVSTNVVFVRLLIRHKITLTVGARIGPISGVTANFLSKFQASQTFVLKRLKG